MDCKIYLQDGRDTTVEKVKNIKAVPHSEIGGSDLSLLRVIVYNDDDPKPVATFYNAVGYELIGRKVVELKMPQLESSNAS